MKSFGNISGLKVLDCADSIPKSETPKTRLSGDLQIQCPKITGISAVPDVEFNQLTATEWLGFAVKAVPLLYDDVLAGRKEILIDGKRGEKGRDVSIDLLGNHQKASGVNLQQPSLFDFRRKRVSEALFNLP